MTYQCPSCGEPFDPADGFCESCGTPVAPAAISSDAGGSALDCPVCSADTSVAPAGVTAGGYCESCGRRVPSGRDHVELDAGLAAGVTDRGLRHTRNEDAMALTATMSPGGPAAVAVVCDGVSSAPRADEASLTAARAAIRALLLAVRAGDDPAAASAAAARAGGTALAGLAGIPRTAIPGRKPCRRSTITCSPPFNPSAMTTSAPLGGPGFTRRGTAFPSCTTNR